MALVVPSNHSNITPPPPPPQTPPTIEDVGRAHVAPAWFNGALQVALQPILDEVQGLRNDVRGVQRELLISGNRSKGDGLRMPFAIVPNGDGNLPDATLNLPELSSVAVLNGLTHAQAMNWYRHYFPAGANNQSRAAMLNQIAHYIGYSAVLD